MSLTGEVHEAEAPMFTAEARDTARSVHGWTAFVALILRLGGLLLFIGAVAGAAFVATKAPADRFSIAALGTLFAIAGMAMMGMGFVLTRYSDHLLIAANQKRGAALLDALPYETGYWVLAALFTLALLASTLAMNRAETLGRDAMNEPQQTTSEAGGASLQLVEGADSKLDRIALGFVIAGAGAIISALIPLRAARG
jgi:hypothetical protein